MYNILEKEILSENVVKLVLENKVIAANRKAGQFVIVKIDEKGERIPLTIASITLSLCLRRSINATDNPFSSALPTSFSFSFFKNSLLSDNASAISLRT